MITAISIRRHEVRTSAILLTIAVAAVATAGTLAMRQGDLGFLQSAFGPPPERPGEYSASWSQRLIYSYVGGRVFLDRPLLGTGWEGELPPADFAEYVPDARERFPDEPAHYFPPTDRDFIPQQTYDQVLFQLGLVGAAACSPRWHCSRSDALRTARDRPRATPPTCRAAGSPPPLPRSRALRSSAARR